MSDEEGEQGGPPKELKVQIIVAKTAPMEVVLGFHSSKPGSGPRSHIIFGFPADTSHACM